MSINKQEFSNRLAIKLDKTKKEACFITDAFLETLRESLISDNKIMFVGDFSLEIVPTNERQGHNPATLEKIIIPAGRKIRFKSGKLLNDLIGG